MYPGVTCPALAIQMHAENKTPLKNGSPSTVQDKVDTCILYLEKAEALFDFYRPSSICYKYGSSSLGNMCRTIG